MRFRYIVLSVITLALGVGYFGLYKPRQRQEIGMNRYHEVTKALDLFYQDCKSFPQAEVGLKALVEKPDDCEKWQGPYLDEALLKDAWGRPYVYTRDEEYYSIDLPEELASED